MKSSAKWCLSAMAAIALAATAVRAATLQGDCDENGSVQINEVQRCANIFIGTMLLSMCPPCDLNGSNEIEINEVQGAANCFLDDTSPGCRMLIATTPTEAPEPTSTNTPEATATLPPVTNTPTPEATATLPPATNTPTPEATATVPLPTDTSTPEPTATPPLPTSTPPPTFTATAGMAVCGNGTVEPGETCDDGNLIDGDACPSTCVINSCVPSGTMVAVDVNFQTPANLISITVFLDYPDGTVQIPGTGTDASVGQRVVNRLPGLATFVDRDYGLRGSISGTAPFQGSRIFRVNFDLCADTPPPMAGEFECTVIEAVGQSFQNVAGVTCSVSTP